MTTVQQVKQVLELALSMSLSVHSIDTEDREQIEKITGQIHDHFSKTLRPLYNPAESDIKKKTLKHPVDVLLKKGKVKLTEKRYEQLTVIYEELTAINIEFLSANQNQHVTWFPLLRKNENDKSAALFLTGGGWSVEALKVEDNGELSGEWEGFDLLDHLAANCPDLDLDDY